MCTFLWEDVAVREDGTGSIGQGEPLPSWLLSILADEYALNVWPVRLTGKFYFLRVRAIFAASWIAKPPSRFSTALFEWPIS